MNFEMEIDSWLTENSESDIYSNNPAKYTAPLGVMDNRVDLWQRRRVNKFEAGRHFSLALWLVVSRWLRRTASVLAPKPSVTPDKK